MEPSGGGEYELLNIGSCRTGDTIVISLVGELDLSTAPGLHDHLSRVIDDGITTVICDLASLRYMDSTGLSVLLLAHKRLEGYGSALVLRFPTPIVRRLFEITGVGAYFDIEPSEASSDDAPGEPSPEA